MKTAYTNLYEVTELQRKIIACIDDWCHKEKTPISQKRIIESIDSPDGTIVQSLNSLINLGYIRKAITNADGETGIGSAKTKYVQLKRL